MIAHSVRSSIGATEKRKSQDFVLFAIKLADGRTWFDNLRTRRSGVPSRNGPNVARDAAIGKPPSLQVFGSQPLLEKRQDLVAGRDRRLTGFVDQVGRHHTMRGRHVALEERRKIVVGRAIGKHPPDESVTQRSV